MGNNNTFISNNSACICYSATVEYENDSWVNAFNATLHIAKSCR